MKNFRGGVTRCRGADSESRLVSVNADVAAFVFSTWQQFNFVLIQKSRKTKLYCLISALPYLDLPFRFLSFPNSLTPSFPRVYVDD